MQNTFKQRTTRDTEQIKHQTNELADLLALIVDVVLDVAQLLERLVDLSLNWLHVQIEAGQLVNQFVLHLHERLDAPR